LSEFSGRHLWASQLRRAENLERLAAVGIHRCPRRSGHDMSSPQKCRSTLSHAVLVDRRARGDVASALASAQAYAPQLVFAGEWAGGRLLAEGAGGRERNLAMGIVLSVGGRGA
jgi:hypothetical protein